MGLLSVNIYLTYSSSVPFKVGNGTLTLTSGAVTDTPALLAEASKTESLLAAPPTVTEGSFCEKAHPTEKTVINAPIATSLIMLLFIVREHSNIFLISSQVFLKEKF